MSMDELGRHTLLQQSQISRIERGLLPPPQIVPFVHRIAEAFGFKPESANFRELVEVACRDRFGEQQGGISQILVVTTGTESTPPLLRKPTAGLGGVSEILTVVPATGDSRVLPRRAAGLSGLPDSVETINAESAFGPHFNPPASPEAAIPPSLAEALDASPEGFLVRRFLTAMTQRGFAIARYARKGATCSMDLRTPKGEEYRLEIRPLGKRSSRS